MTASLRKNVWHWKASLVIDLKSEVVHLLPYKSQNDYFPWGNCLVFMPSLVIRMRICTSFPSLCKREVTIVHLFTYYGKWASIFLYVTVRLSEQSNLSDNFCCCIVCCFASCFFFQLLPFLWLDTMVDVQMRGALVCCGFSTQTSNFLIAQGISCPADLLLVKDSDIDVMIRNSSRNMPDNVQFPFLAVRKLHTLWFGWRNATGPERTCYQLLSMTLQ